MWELHLANPFGRLSGRNFLVWASGVLVAAFAFIFFTSPLAHAADADWNGAAITYNGQKYSSVPDAKAGDSHALPAGTKIYMYVEPPPAGTGAQKAHLIYFPPGTDPAKATSANYATYEFTPPSTFKNPTEQKTLSLTPQGPSSSGTTSCDSTFTAGIGWIVCPVTNFLAGAMDWLFNILAGFLAVRPVQTDSETALYRAWSYMRNFANVAFVIAFLIIIYSQLSNIGLSNYSIKNMLPRLIVAAILVNISYWVCAIAIDASNILGYSIQDIFISMRNGLVGGEGNSWDVVSWKSIASFILSGGAATAGLGIGAYAVLAGTVGGAIYLLLPILVGVLMAVLVALLVLALRQALITVLVIISPLAFVAYLLPNTEKYFEKWRELGTTMLVMFPMFSVIFGGSQLAGIAIIQNADTINLIILGMAVQIAPVVVTPLLVRFSGSLLGRIAGMVNNPNKGIIDRTRKWSQERADQHKARVLANPANRRRDMFARATQGIDNSRRRRKGWQQANEAMADARWANHYNSHAIHEAAEDAKMLKETGEAASQAAVESLRTTNGHNIQLRDVNLRLAKLDLDVAKARGDVQWENLRTRDTDNLNVIPGHLLQQAREARSQTLGSQVVASQMRIAQSEQQADYASALRANVAMQQEAGGIGQRGADTALATAVYAERGAYAEHVKEAHQVLEHFNLSSEERQSHAMGGNVTVRDRNGNVRTFTAADLFTREAAIEKQIQTGTVEQAERIIAQSGTGASLEGFRTTIADEVAKAGLSAKTVYLGGATINEISKGTVNSENRLTGIVQENIAKGKFSADKLVSIDKDAVASVVKAAREALVNNNISGMANTTPEERALIANLPGNIQALKDAANLALTDPRLKPRVASNVKNYLEQLINL